MLLKKIFFSNMNGDVFADDLAIFSRVKVVILYLLEVF